MKCNIDITDDGISYFAFFLMLAVVLFGVTQCARESEKQTIIENSNYQECIDYCPQDFSGNFKDLECPEMCAELINDVEPIKGVK